MKNRKIAITTGDPNGIGAEITIKALKCLNLDREKYLVISNKEILNFYGLKNIDFELIEIEYDKSNIKPSLLTQEAGEFSFQSLKTACELAKEDRISALVTAPVAKEAMHLAGHKFNGQTEVLQKYLAHDNQHAEMLFVAKDFRVLLLTRHVAIKKVELNKENLYEKIKDINKIFQKNLNIENPKFALCSFNPHAGEGGILGDEEVNILNPLAEELRQSKIDITNPLPSDTLFVKGVQNYLKGEKMPYDCYLACYHDQGLIPIKTVGGSDTVNTTIGLDIIRTSPCHGTAFDIAGKNIASEKSMIAAIKQVL